MIFETQQTLIRGVEKVKQGTLAFVISDQLLYIRGNRGWRTITVRQMEQFITQLSATSFPGKIPGNEVELSYRCV